MYKTYFGLNKRPFRALAAGTDVFVGPQTAATMAALKKALADPDTVVAVNGPVGVGKTTLVRRALDAVGTSQLIISVGRMQLGHDEVLELLLEEMGAQIPPGTVQRFTTFRRLLKEQADKGTRVFVVVEDATRVGADALSELEALTASDAGVSEGANIVLMGDQNMNEVLKAPRLTRLRQRLRLRQAISPLSAGELTGYFKHSFRLAGKEFDTLFEPGTANLLHSLSGGIPRMANNIVESVLSSAAESKQDRIGVALIKLIATEEYGLDTAQEAQVPDTPVVPVVVDAARDVPQEPVAEPTPQVVPEQAHFDDSDEDSAIPELIQDTLPDLEILAPHLANPGLQEQAEEQPAPESPAVGPVAADNIPTLSSSVDADTAAEDAVPEWERNPTLAQLRPDLDALEHAMAVAQGLEPDTDEEEDGPDAAAEPPERVPEITLDREIQAKIDEAAELLKQAELEAAELDDSDTDSSNTAKKPVPKPIVQVKPPQAPKPAVKVEPASPPASAAQEKPAPVEKPAVKVKPPSAPLTAATAEPPAALKPAANIEPPPAPKPVVHAKPKPAPIPVVHAKPKPKPAPIPVVHAEPKPAPIPVVHAEPKPEPVVAPPVASEAPQQASSKPDAELEKIAADLARAKTIDDCDDKMAETLFGEEFSMMAAEVAANAPTDLSANDELELAADESGAVPIADLDGAAAVNIELNTRPNGTVGKFDPTASQRFATVRALNGSPNSPTPAAEQDVMSNGESAATPVADHPESIEEQINTSMTQTLKALSARPPHDDDDDEENKGGFFSRFRRS